MRLTVTQDDHLVNQNHFVKGPIHIGRDPQSQVFLPNQSVSRQHAVIFLAGEGQWMIKDLQSANKTFVNGKALMESPLKTGDHVTVGNCAYDGESFILQHKAIKKLIERACQERQYFLLFHVGQYTSQTREQSAIVASILAQGRIFGEMYLESKPDGAAFTMSDLDYAMLVSIGIGAVQRNF